MTNQPALKLQLQLIDFWQERLQEAIECIQACVSADEMDEELYTYWMKRRERSKDNLFAAITNQPIDYSLIG